MATPNITDPFFRALYNRLAEEIDSRVNALASGSALVLGEKTGLDPQSIALKYQEQVAYIQALQAVIQLGIEIDYDRYGGNKKQIDDGDS